jgi:hypothetical protein
MNKIIKISLIKILSFFFSKCIILSLIYYQKIKKKNLFYPISGGFGDNLAFYLYYYSKIKKNNFYLFKFNKRIDAPLDFFFDKKKILEPILSIPFRIYYYARSEINKSKYFKPAIINSDHINFINRNRRYKDSIRKLIEIKLKYFRPSDKLESFFKKEYKYFCFFIKLNLEKNDIFGSQARATFDKKKIFELLNYLVSKNYVVVVLGLNTDPSIKIIRKYINNLKLESKIFLFLDISNMYSFVDQLFIAKNSISYLGNGSGICEVFSFLQKKIIVFDHTKVDYHTLPFCKNIKILLKKVQIDGIIEALTDKNINIVLNNQNNFKYNIIENTFEEIKLEINNFITNKS